MSQLVAYHARCIYVVPAHSGNGVFAYKNSSFFEEVSRRIDRD